MTAIKPATQEAFQVLVESLEKRPGYRQPMAFGIGIGHTDKQGELIEVFYPHPNFGTSFDTAAVMAEVLGWNCETGYVKVSREQIDEILSYFQAFEDDGNTHPNIEALKDMRTALYRMSSDGSRKVVAMFIIDVGKLPTSVPDVYLRLQLMSHRLTRPNSMNLDGIFGLLRNIAWTSDGPIPFEDLHEVQLNARIDGQPLTVHSVDKFPRMLDYVVPSGIRIVNGANVRLGAYVGIGTTVMSAGFINYNAGTEDAIPEMELEGCMIEGRISQGCWVGAGSDIGGGASLMGTLSGGGTERVSMGRKCLLGALSGLGIALGDNCIVEAGLYITASTPVTVVEKTGRTDVLKARKLSGKDGLMYIRHGETGRVEARPNKKAVVLNETLHKN